MAEEDIGIPQSPTPTFVASFSQFSAGDSMGPREDAPPFKESDQLCKDLEYVNPIEKSPQLRNRRIDQILPDAPRIALESSHIASYCLEDLDTPQMNKLDEKLWWVGPSPYVKSLSHQLAFDRKIIVTENPSLHLVWAERNLYLKPLPSYITSHAFWQYLLDPTSNDFSVEQREQIKTTSLGFLRTYAHLIQRRSDFNLARQNDLFSSFGHVSFESFIGFIKAFDSIPDKDVSSRWRFGELQLDALNFHSVIHLRRWHLNRFESNYNHYFQRFFPVVLFMYATFSVILNAMQVILAGRQMWDTNNRGLKRTLGLFEWFSTEAIGWGLGLGIAFLLWWIAIISAETWKRRTTMKRVKKRQKEEKALDP